MPTPRPKADAGIRIIIHRRDLAILLLLYECRMAATHQIADIHFEGSLHAARKRLLTLKKAGLIVERERKPFESAVLTITKAGVETLRERGLLAHYPQRPNPTYLQRAPTEKHELGVMAVKAAIHRTVDRRFGVTIAHFSTWPQRNAFVAMGEYVKPDAFFRITEKRWNGRVGHTFYLEYDCSTESHTVLRKKAQQYRVHLDDLRYKHRRAKNRRPLRLPRILFVFRTEERLRRVGRAFSRGAFTVRTEVWLTTEAEVLSDALGPIWLRPDNLREPRGWKLRLF